MENQINFYGWFNKVINTIICFFFVLSFISTIFVFTSFFDGIIKYLITTLFFGIISILIVRFKSNIQTIIDCILHRLQKLSLNKMLLIIIITAIILKIIYSVFFYFDSTKLGGDITIYSNIADEIVINGFRNVDSWIYYLVGVGTHLSIFKMLNVPYHVGTTLVILIGTILNFFSFSRLIGKEKSFVLIELYLLMPSSMMLTFCITHEIFVYFYFSIILFLLCQLYRCDDLKKKIILYLLIFIFITLNQTVSPIGKIWYIVLAILVLLTNIKMNKKITLIVIMVASLLLTNVLTTRFEGNTSSQSNNIEQLLIGCNLESMGRHTDGRGKQAARKYWESKGVELTLDNLVEGEKGALIEEYKYLIAHPFKLIELLANKFYVAWSGDFYSIELGYACGAISNYVYYIMLGISTMIWLIIMILSVFFNHNSDGNICIDTYKLVLLGVVAVLLITEITNKYSCYMTLFIYFIAFSRIGDLSKK